MRSNHFDSMILGTINHWPRICRRRYASVGAAHSHCKFARRLSLRLGSWRALKRMPAGDDAGHGDVSELFGQSLPARPALDVGRRSRPRHSRRPLIGRVR